MTTSGLAILCAKLSRAFLVDGGEKLLVFGNLDFIHFSSFSSFGDWRGRIPRVHVSSRDSPGYISVFIFHTMNILHIFSFSLQYNTLDTNQRTFICSTFEFREWWRGPPLPGRRKIPYLAVWYGSPHTRRPIEDVFIDIEDCSASSSGE